MFSIYNIRFLDIMIGQQLIITEEIQFSEPSYLCNVVTPVVSFLKKII